MISIKEIREKYPQYSDMKDDQLADSLHSKYYSDIPKDDFYQKIGLQPENKEVNPEEKGTFDKIVDPIIAAGEATGKGLRHAVSAPAQFINPFIDQATKDTLDTDLTGSLNAYNKREDEAYRKRNPNPGITEQTISNVTEGLPSVLAGGGVSAGAKGLGGLANLVASGAASAPFVYDESGTLNPSQKTAIGGAIGGGVYGLGRLASTAKSGYSNLISKLFNKSAGETNPAELEKVIEANKDLKTGIGDIVNSPALSGLQNGISHIPFSGVEKSQLGTANKLTEEGNAILDDLISGTNKPENIGDFVKTELNTSKFNAREKNKSLYDKVAEIADSSDANVNANNYQKEAKVILDEIKSSRPFGKLKNTDKDDLVKFLEEVAKKNPRADKEYIENSKEILKDNRKKSSDIINRLNSGEPNSEDLSIVKNTLSEMAKGKPEALKFVKEFNDNPTEDQLKIASEALQSLKGNNTLNKFLSNKKKPMIGSFSEANYMIKDLRESADKSFSDKNDFIGGVYSRLKRSLQKDVDTGIKKSNSPELRKAYSESQKDYAKNVAPFKDKDIMKFTSGDGDSDTIVSHFIKGGKDDRVKLLSKLTDKIGPEAKKLLSYEYFKPAFKSGINGEDLNPRKMMSLYNHLGDKTKEKLFGKDVVDRMKDYQVRLSKNNKAFDAMYSPKNGYRLSQIMGAAELTTALGGLFSGHPAVAGSMAALSGGANLLNRGLNSKWIRDLYVNGYKPLRGVHPIEGGVSGYLQDLLQDSRKKR